jgi:catechol 2,3-dioxygenase-like lactoylglutathione lyase family enzyme
MKHTANSIRTFIGAKDYQLSRQFYKDLGFEEVVLFHNMCYFKVTDQLGFYLQDAYVKDWVDNSMIFLEVQDVEKYYTQLELLGLHHKYETVRLSAIQFNDWGNECFLHDPSGILWHFGQFNR